ncbi:hypothetical protein [Bradyrhizobium algeriense]|uniref:hypothetical protein n=1 Tax=Bradyrhizobium algeriense TaxID=634784 RepID=UPI001FCEA98C|nr:hypothetical protein [Bradyrhizobium algeriense]
MLDTSNVNHSMLLPILLHCRDDQGQPVLGSPRSGRETADFLRNAYADIPAVVEAMRAHRLTQNVTGQLLADDWGDVTESVRWPLWRERSAWARGARSCRRVTERSRSVKRAEKGRILDALCATTGWHRKHAVRALRQHEPVRPNGVEAPRERRRKYGATIKDALTALWEASDRVCGKRIKAMIPTLLPALEQHGRLKLGFADRDRVLAISPATIDRMLVDVKVPASGGRRRRAGFYSAIRREVPIRTFNDWNSLLRGRHGSPWRHVGGLARSSRP